jgi:hypothetical protein
MTARQQRRAAERQALKASQAQLAANRVNSQLSTGPKTEAGRAISSQNALKTALTGRTVLLPTDNLDEYKSLQTQFLNTYKPATEDERALVQHLLDTTWRIKRILSLEFAIFAKGSVEFANEFPDLDADARNQIILAETYLKYEKSIRNLNTQEARLQRKLTKDLAELTRLQTERRQLEAISPAKKPEIGFVFSNSAAPTTQTTNPTTAPAPESPDKAMAA